MNLLSNAVKYTPEGGTIHLLVVLNMNNLLDILHIILLLLLLHLLVLHI